MKYFAAILRLLDQEKNVALRPQHLAFLKEHEAQGRIFSRGPFADGSGGLVIYQAASLESAAELAKRDPYVAQGARRLELHEWLMWPAPDSKQTPRIIKKISAKGT
ncbi:MAG TPA: YciI family protein [Terriglobia bacterium]|nr:YciI family protein [Terriglobia bacterium]